MQDALRAPYESREQYTYTSLTSTTRRIGADFRVFSCTYMYKGRDTDHRIRLTMNANVKQASAKNPAVSYSGVLDYPAAVGSGLSLSFRSRLVFAIACQWAADAR